MGEYKGSDMKYKGGNKMNREIKFRGKDIVHNEWCYGSYMPPFYENDTPYIWMKEDRIDHWEYISSQVAAETVGQYTGLKDKNGVEIYEGDILFDKDGVHYGIVKWNILGFELHSRHMDCYDNIVCEVVGNIHDNPELAERILNPKEIGELIKEARP